MITTHAQMPSRPRYGVRRDALESPTDPNLTRSGYEDDGGAVSGNFNFVVPVIGLPGRGMDLRLNLIYNSQVWAMIGNKPIFNPDADWPAPGWSLGFGKLSRVLLIDADGTRHPLAIVDATHSRTADATFRDVEWYTGGARDSYTNS